MGSGRRGGRRDGLGDFAGGECGVSAGFGVWGVSGVREWVWLAEGGGLAADVPGKRGEPMNAEGEKSVTRRRVLEEGAVAALGATAVMRGAEGRAATPADENPWRYDVDRLRHVDPAAIGYEKSSGFSLESTGGRRLVWASANEILVAAGKSVRGYRPNGEKTGEWKVGEVVRAVAVTSEGRRFVALRDRVEVYDRQGERVARWPAVAGKPFLTGLALAEDAVFVADSGNRVVYRCDFSGRIEVRIGEKNPGKQVPGLVLPSPYLDVEVGADGLIRVNNPGRHRIEVYTRDGDLEQSWGKAGVALEGFCGCCNPVAVGLMGDGRVVTAEKGLPRVKVYGAAGGLETVVAGPDAFAPVGSDERHRRSMSETAEEGLDVAVSSEGSVAVLDVPGGTVQVFRSKGPSNRAG